MIRIVLAMGCAALGCKPAEPPPENDAGRPFCADACQWFTGVAGTDSYRGYQFQCGDDICGNPDACGTCAADDVCYDSDRPPVTGRWCTRADLPPGDAGPACALSCPPGTHCWPLGSECRPDSSACDFVECPLEVTMLRTGTTDAETHPGCCLDGSASYAERTFHHGVACGHDLGAGCREYNRLADWDAAWTLSSTTMRCEFPGGTIDCPAAWWVDHLGERTFWSGCCGAYPAEYAVPYCGIAALGAGSSGCQPPQAGDEPFSQP